MKRKPALKTPTEAELTAFKEALKALFIEHGLSIRHYHIQYDEYDSDDGIEIVPYGYGIEDFDLCLASYRKVR